MPATAHEKRQLMEQLLASGMVMVGLDARVEGVDVPGHLRSDPGLRLNLSQRFSGGMELDDWGVSCRLTFGGYPYDCKIPWDAIYLVVSHVSGRPHLFPEHVPQDIQIAPTTSGQAHKPKLEVVENEISAAVADDVQAPPQPPEEPTPPSPRPARGHLRLVK